MKKIILGLSFLGLFNFTQAQSVGINTATPHVSAILEVIPSGTYKSWTVPTIFLSTETTKTGIVGGNPAESLLVYNSNPNLPAGKGLYYWSTTDQKWLFIVSQHSIDLFRNLTRYYTIDTQYETVLSNTATGSELFALDSGTTGWTMIKDTGGATLEIPITVDQPTNFLDINLSGTWITSSSANSTSVNRGVDIVYGVFVNDKLKYIKSDSFLALNPCTINNFYVNANIPNVSTTSDKITFGVKLRRIQGAANSTTTFPSGTTIKIGGVSTGATQGCKNANAFENTTKATVYVNQKL